MITGQKFSPILTPWEVDVTKTFMYLLSDDRKEFFNSDDFREYNLHVFMTDPAHEIGGLFAKWKWNRIVEAYGDIPSKIKSNNKRKVDLMSWNMRNWHTYLRQHQSLNMQMESQILGA